MSRYNELTAAEQLELNTIIQKRQMFEFVSLYNRLSHHCFNSCISDFTNRTLVGKEKRCVELCVHKFLKTSMRISQRYQENQEKAQEAHQSIGNVQDVFTEKPQQGAPA